MLVGDTALLIEWRNMEKDRKMKVRGDRGDPSNTFPNQQIEISFYQKTGVPIQGSSPDQRYEAEKALFHEI